MKEKAPVGRVVHEPQVLEEHTEKLDSFEMERWCPRLYTGSESALTERSLSVSALHLTWIRAKTTSLRSREESSLEFLERDNPTTAVCNKSLTLQMQHGGTIRNGTEANYAQIAKRGGTKGDS
jgi:hypothetical protein